MVPRLLEQGREDVSDHHTHPRPVLNADRTIDGYRAACCCGWRGIVRTSIASTEADGREHEGRAVKGSADYIDDAGRRVDKILNSPRHPVEQG